MTTIHSYTNDQRILNIKLKENNGGIGYVSFFINNVEIEENVNPEFVSEISIELKDYEEYLIPGRPNILGVVVYNSADSRRAFTPILDLVNNNSSANSDKGWLKSRQKRIPIRYGEPHLDFDGGNTKGWDDARQKT